ncbi:MAG: hypothetical protein EB078_07435 [Proteobacteria bacterium]|nr:hypothetical protein [Pseudomonadota bacterium]NDD04722.1 hypothetical protein [Pseudomonadota bacterium]
MGSPARGAYRLFKLKVTSFDERNRRQKQEVVLSTLDHHQYENYYAGYGRTLVQLIDTWYCPGDTSGKKYCDKPKEMRLQRGPAGIFAPKRDLPLNQQPVIP